MKDVFTEQRNLIKPLKEDGIKYLEQYSSYKKAFEAFMQAHPDIASKTDVDLANNHARIYKELCLYLSDQTSIKNALFALSPNKIKTLKQTEELIANFPSLPEEVFDKIFNTLKNNMTIQECPVSGNTHALTNIPYYQKNISIAEHALDLLKKCTPLKPELLTEIQDRLVNDAENFQVVHEKHKKELAASTSRINASVAIDPDRKPDKFELAQNTIDDAAIFLGKEGKDLPDDIKNNITKQIATLQHTVNNYKTGFSKSVVTSQTITLRSTLAHAAEQVRRSLQD